MYHQNLLISNRFIKKVNIFAMHEKFVLIIIFCLMKLNNT